ncbi:hypothetical protein QVD17_29777 [Tagetes erecta]|uniref:Uncharacterized protein n=1 Tax=Tagetes erecta TaxID=13708 RepID=A0AAD8K089_TARER|nr:hypothetical protein QVD17_29777 [Tagetes erecta]
MNNRYDYVKGKFTPWTRLKNKTGNLYDYSKNTFNLTEDEWQTEIKVCRIFWEPSSTLPHPSEEVFDYNLYGRDDIESTDMEPVTQGVSVGDALLKAWFPDLFLLEKNKRFTWVHNNKFNDKWIWEDGANGDFWLKVCYDKPITLSGSIRDCLDCHSGMNGSKEAKETIIDSSTSDVHTIPSIHPLPSILRVPNSSILQIHLPISIRLVPSSSIDQFIFLQFQR